MSTYTHAIDLRAICNNFAVRFHGPHKTNSMASLYIHIPFCRTRCNYCDFYKSTACADANDYITALEREMEYRRDYFGSEPVDTVFFGGGTPSVLPPVTLQRVLDKAATLWNLGHVKEITVEANPDDITDSYLDALTDTDINRISFGVQSFIDRDLRMMGRRHNAAQAIQAVEAVHRKGYDNVSIDLIFGVPGMTTEEWSQNVRTAADLGVSHISAYCLTIAEGTVFGNMEASGRLIPASDEECETHYLACHDLLTAHGFEHYEISNYALPGRRARHNMAYWNGRRYLGLGPSAHSYDGTHRTYAASDVKGYIKDAGSDTIYDGETLSHADKYNEFIMTALRTSDGINPEHMAERFGSIGMEFFSDSVKRFIEEGCIAFNGTSYRIPPEKWMVSNDIISELFYVE